MATMGGCVLAVVLQSSFEFGYVDDTNRRRMMVKLRWPHLDFIAVHYLYVLGLGILGLVLLSPDGNLSSTDAYFFGVSASTESGLNVVNLNDLRLYQQITLYFIPILGNMQVVSILIVIFRFFWFRKHLKSKVDKNQMTKAKIDLDHDEVETTKSVNVNEKDIPVRATSWDSPPHGHRTASDPTTELRRSTSNATARDAPATVEPTLNKDLQLEASSSPPATSMGIRRSETDLPASTPTHIRFAPEPRPVRRANTQAILDQQLSSDEEYAYSLDENRGRSHDPYHDLPKLGFSRAQSSESIEASLRLRQKRERSRSGTRRSRGPSADRLSIHRVVTNMFELGGRDAIPVAPSYKLAAGLPLSRTISRESATSKHDLRRASRLDKLKLSTNAMLGRNSNFSNLTSEDKDRLGGIEYRSLKLLIKVIVGYYLSLHVIGIVCLTPWIYLTQQPKYRQHLRDSGINPVWWSIYSAGTMANNLGFTLTPDSMISFRDSVFPILIMTILAYAGHTFYPVCLRVIIWTMTKLYSKEHKIQQSLHFLLDHPRRCYTLLFPSRQTWILAIVLIALNIVDVILIICLDLDNPEVTQVPIAPRFISSIFQAASSRHTGTSTFNLANVNPGVQFSLLVMMYVSIFPIAISVRSSNTYEETSLGVYHDEEVDPDSAQDGKSYLLAHVRNQLSFDLWYIFLGCFCICCSEAGRIMDQQDPAFQVFPVFFEVASAYGNVGLSLGHPSVSTSFSGVFNTFSKLVICAMMIRGRHRGLPVRLDRAILLPSEKFSAVDEESRTESTWQAVKRLPKLNKAYTQ